MGSNRRDIEEYRARAAECIALAQQAVVADVRVGLLGMAKAWQGLADQAEKYGNMAIVYETPDPTQHVAQQQQQAQPKKDGN